MSKQTIADAELEQLSALRAAIKVGDDDIDAGRYEDVDDVTSWVQKIAETVSTKSVA